MIEFYDFNECETYPKFYGGNAGRKEAVILDDAVWMLKYPERTAGMSGNVLSYTTSPVSEFIGSHVYESLGIPVHETLLGTRFGKVVVACKDFVSQLAPGETFYDMHDVKNSAADDSPLPDGRPSSGSSLYLSDLLSFLETDPVIRAVDGALDRFWDMFVVDALIGNADRNNSNWGIIVASDGHARLAPVFDNDNAFFNKRRPESSRHTLESPSDVEGLAIGSCTSCYLRDDGHKVKPFSYMTALADKDCTMACARIADRLDLDYIRLLMAELPTDVKGMPVMPGETLELLGRVLDMRAARILKVRDLWREEGHDER